MTPRGRTGAPGRGRRPGQPTRSTPRGSGRGGASRARQTTPRVAATPEPRRPRYTNRMALLVVVVAVLVISYASSMRAYLQQREDINDLKAQIASSQKEIKALETEKMRWQDKAFVKAQARERFGWVLPGETAYQVLDKDGRPMTTEQELTDPDSVAPRPPEAWWSRAQTSLDAADHPEKYEKTPAERLTQASTGADD